MTRIVVGVDGSPGSIAALREGRRLGEALDAEVEAIACWELPALYVAVEPAVVRQNTTEMLQETLRLAFGEQTPAGVRPSVVRGPARQVLIEASRTARLLVVGRRGDSPLGGFFVGSVSTAAVARAHCPVVVVPSEEDAVDG